MRKKKRVKMHLTKIYRITAFFIIGSLYSGCLFAQEEVKAEEDKSDCVIQLELAQSKYDQGRIQDVEELISTCIESGEFSKAEKTSALKLLTLSYLFLEEPELAESTMLGLLETSHEFEINEAIDPSEFINLYNKYRTEPLYSVGFMLGGIVANPIITELNGTPDLNNDSRQKYTPLFGIKGAINGEYKIYPKLYLHGELNYSSIKFQKSHPTKKIISETDLGGFEGEETHTSLGISLLAQYQFIDKKLIKPYVSLGVSPQFLVSAEYPGDALKYKIEGSADATSGNIGLDKDRKLFNLYAVAIGGLKYKIGEGFLNLQVRYSYGIFQSTKKESALAPDDPNLLWDLNESSDGFRMQDLAVSLGYTIHFYVPKKLR